MLHSDVGAHENLLMHVQGNKSVYLWHPKHAPLLCLEGNEPPAYLTNEGVDAGNDPETGYVNFSEFGPTAPLAPQLNACPHGALAMQKKERVLLLPGDVLFIPEGA